MAMATSSASCSEFEKNFGSVEDITKSSPQDAKFDAVVGELESLLLDEQFLSMQENFLKRYNSEFDDDEENKLVYTEIFKKWTQSIERFIEKRLRTTLPWFTMAEFTKMLHERPDEQSLDGDVFDVLATLGDFTAFKELIIAYRNSKTRKKNVIRGSAAGMSAGGFLALIFWGKEQEGTGIDLSGILTQHGVGQRA